MELRAGSIEESQSASHRSGVFLARLPSPTYRDATAALEIEMACRREHRMCVEVERDQIQNVDLERDAGIVPVDSERPESLLAAASARVGSTSSSSTTPPMRAGEGGRR